MIIITQFATRLLDTGIIPIIPIVAVTGIYGR